MFRSSFRLVTVLASLTCSGILAQLREPPAVIEIDIENFRFYLFDSADFTKWGTNPNRVDVALHRNFNTMQAIGDVIAVNGQPAKGTITATAGSIGGDPVPMPGSSPSDVPGTSRLIYEIDLLQPDGTPIGSLFAMGRNTGQPPPGSVGATGGNLVIVGGTGAYLGARGQILFGVALPQSSPLARGSFTEDPINRRVFGGLAFRRIAYVIPEWRPEIFQRNGAAATFHADFTPVTAERPSRPGETVILQVTGLGPTRPGIPFGQPFPQQPPHIVNSPIEVTVNGQSVPVVSKIGWPGLVDTFRVDIQLPNNISGPAMVRVTAAWIPGAEVRIPIR